MSPDDTMCGPDSGSQCNECLHTHWALASDEPDPHLAFVEDVLRIMPVKDDRVLPDELCKALMDTRLWAQLDLRKRPPVHRRG